MATQMLKSFCVMSRLLKTTALQAKPRRLHIFSALKGAQPEGKDPKPEAEIVRVTYVDKEGRSFEIEGRVGDNAMYLAQKNGIEMEGACEASLACTTCHVYVAPEYLERLEPASDKEEDLLDLAPYLKENSRLGCQIILTKDMDGLELRLPKATRNFYVDGHKPKPH